MMQKQKIFDIAVSGLYAQGKAAFQESNNETGAEYQGCVYRTDAGLKCAVGQLISHKHYRPALEGMVAAGQAVRSAIEESQGFTVEPSSYDLLRDMQHAHDGLAQDGFQEWSNELMVHYMNKVAEKHDLEPFTPPPASSDSALPVAAIALLEHRMVAKQCSD